MYFFYSWINDSPRSIDDPGIQSPLPKVEGKVLSINDKNGNKIECANSGTDAIEQFYNYIASMMVPKQGLRDTIVVTSNKYFYQLTLKDQLAEFKVVNIFKCSYFKPIGDSSAHTYTYPYTVRLGYFYGNATEEIDNLIWLLNDLHNIGDVGFNQSKKMISSSTEQDTNKIYRVDKWKHSVFDDTSTWPSGSSSLLFYKYSFDKNTKELVLEINEK